jgi:thiosulfate dehydrogenase [quinone] large subunit
MKKLETTAQPAVVTDPPIARFLFGDLRLAWLWLPLRVWLGWDWLNHGWDKFQNPAWIDTGAALKSFWERAIDVDPKPVVMYDWYRDFL